MRTIVVVLVPKSAQKAYKPTDGLWRRKTTATINNEKKMLSKSVLRSKTSKSVVYCSTLKKRESLQQSYGAVWCIKEKE